MFLKRLTVKGFKSFAEPTTLEFEPGVTAVVGPNGSGKSNVVDAVTWVLGAQSTRALRSAKMEDVIFVGTASRPPLGRAEVSLTLDNASGRLPVDGAEVTISRTLFRNGESEYAINGTTCRLLDVQELLSDSGVGRQQHMIIGQGQLDAVLNSRPEDRRAVIEEAAGVLKHRRRKERAERRLEATQENLERLGDLVREVRRQMRPLERQAVAARSFADVEAELREAQRFAFATRLDVFLARRRVLDDRLHESSRRDQELRQAVRGLDARAAAAAIEISSHREEELASGLAQLGELAERARGTVSLIDERTRSARAAVTASADEDVIASLEADAAHLADEATRLDDESAALVDPRTELDSATSALAEAEAQFESTWGDAARANAQVELRERTERLTAQGRAAAAAAEGYQRALDRDADARSRLESARAEFDALTSAVGDAARATEQSGHLLDSARADADAATRRRDEAAARWRTAIDESSRARARAEALAHAFAELSGAATADLLADQEGVLGSLLASVDVAPGFERALEVAVGAAAGGVMVEGQPALRVALNTLRREGGAGLVLPVGASGASSNLRVPGGEPLRDHVTRRTSAPASVDGVLDALLASVIVAADVDAAIDLAYAHPNVVVVTREGDRFAPTGWRVSSGRSIVTRAAVEEADHHALEAESTSRTAGEAATTAESALTDAHRRMADAAATHAHTASDGDALRARSDAMGRTVAGLAAPREDAASALAAATRARDEAESERRTLAAAVEMLERTVSDEAEQVRWAEEARVTLQAHRDQVAARRADVAAREAALTERGRITRARRDEVEARLAGRGEERRAATARRERLEFDVDALGRLRTIVEAVAAQASLARESLATTYREQIEASRAGAELLDTLRRERAARESELSALGDESRSDEIERAELAVKIANLHDLIRRELNESPESIVGAPAPTLAAGVSIEARLAELEVRISSLGPINPLALEELTELETRYKELDAQVSDVRHARRELQEVVRTLDEQIMTSFSSAVADVNEHFSTLIAMLFPGGQGRLILTEPDDPLHTGVEIEVRPLGRNVRRISLLSGGERSMAALAFLFAVFRSRPSPFYMMDEVEAALDDVNLQRFLSLVDEFRHEAQLLIVTHQKRTMEAADALYGVTMAPGGSSKVVSQRVRRDGGESPE